MHFQRLALLSAVICSAAFGQAIYAPDCNDPDAKDRNCTEPTKAIIQDAQTAGYPYYVGHAEPTTLFFSNAGASGSNMRWRFKLPASEPTPTQNGANVANFELYSTFWTGLALCDPNSNPFGPCTAASDANNPSTAGAAFLELQFYPPGINCSNTQWCVNLHINTLQNINTFQKNNCLEPTTAAYVTTNGAPAGPKLLMNNGDTIVVTIHDTANGLQTDVNDLTTGTTGTMVASGANGYVHNSDQSTCATTPFNFHAMYATAAPGQVVPWAALGPNVSFDFEIGHFELCGDVSCSILPPPPADPAPDNTDCATVRGVGGCFRSDLDHDGTSYAADWPDGTAAHPASVILGSSNNTGVGPLSAATSASTTYSQGYKTIKFMTTEATTGPFYPFWTQAGTGSSCVFNFGNDIPGTTTSDFGKAAQYGTTITNPCFPAFAIAPVLSKAFSQPQIPLNSTVQLTFTISNTNPATPLTGVSFSDTLPAGLTGPTLVSGSCGGGTLTVGAAAISLANATIPAAGSCTFTISVTGATTGVKINLTGTVTSNEGGDGNTATASVTVLAPPSITKAFNPGKVIPGGTSALSFSISNPNSFAALTGVAFNDALPAGVIVAAPTGLTGACGGGVITAAPGAGAVSLSGATLAASASCTFSVNVTGTTEGIKLNSVSISSTNAGPGNTSSATLFVATPPRLTKAFGELSILDLSSTSLTFTLTNPNQILTLTGLTFSDVLPAGLVIAAPNGLTGSCGGGVISAVSGGNLITLASASLAAGVSCTFSVTVMSDGSVFGNVTNTSGTVTSVEAIPGASASASLFIGNPYQLRYTSNLTAGDSVVNISNTGASGGVTLQSGTSASIGGSICANVYVFQPDEQVVSCCSCPVTPNGLVSLSSLRDLINNPLFAHGAPASAVVKLVATLPVGGSCANSAAGVASATLANGMVAWGTTLHANNSAGPNTYNLTETAFTPNSLNASELSRLASVCSFALAQGSGNGICNSCRLGGLGAANQ